MSALFQLVLLCVLAQVFFPPAGTLTHGQKVKVYFPPVEAIGAESQLIDCTVDILGERLNLDGTDKRFWVPLDLYPPDWILSKKSKPLGGGE